MKKTTKTLRNKESSALSVKSKNRRKLLGAIAAGGAVANLLPSKWSKPVVDSILLPAHAQMSPGALLPTFDCTVTGFLFSNTISNSGFNWVALTSSFSQNLTSSRAEFTFALVTGLISAVATFIGSAIASYTALSSTGSQFTPFIFDSTCAN